jgi:hypothetical protein
MTPRDFIAKWSPGAPAHGLGERAGAQAHFIDLCRLLGVAAPTDDPDDDGYTFEKRITKTTGGRGFADVWRRGHFALEYKSLARAVNLPAAAYAENPHAIAIAEAARALVAARDAWLNPPDLVDRVPEVVPGFPERIIPKNPAAAARLRARTLTALYNSRGTPEGAWLECLHAALDAAVAAAYGWPADISEEAALARLLALNQARAAAQPAAAPRPRRPRA